MVSSELPVYRDVWEMVSQMKGVYGAEKLYSIHTYKSKAI